MSESTNRDPNKLQSLDDWLKKEGIYKECTETAERRIASTPPAPMYYGFFPWLWKRLTGWRDGYGRKAQLFPYLFHREG